MWIDQNSIEHFTAQAERQGSVMLEGLPLAQERFLTASGLPQTSLLISRTEAGTFAVLVPEDLTPRVAGLAPPFSNGTCVQGWRILALPPCHTVAQALGYSGYLLGLQTDWSPEEAASTAPAAAADNHMEGPAAGVTHSGNVQVPSAQREPAGREGTGSLPFTRDLTEAARRGELPPVVGREAETDQVITILLQHDKNCPVLVGEPGVGKTAIVERLAGLSAEERLPPRLHGLRVMALDVSQLVADSGHKGALEKNVIRLMEGLSADPLLLLFVDEIHTLTDARGDLSVLEIMKPRLARGLRVVGATTHGEFKQKIAQDQALVRRFDLVSVPEPSPEETKSILSGRLPALETHHAVSVSLELVERVVALADEYFPDRHRPDKALTLLDRAMAAESLKASRSRQ